MTSQLNPQPSITSVSPSGTPVGGNSQVLTINGSGFLVSSAATFNGISHSITFNSSTQLTISLTTSDLEHIGTFSVVVANPPPGGGSSNTVIFRVQGGTLQVQVTGLPAGTNANVSVNSGGGFSKMLSSSQSLQLAPANYLITANAVPVANTNYYSTPAQQSVDLTDGSSDSVEVPYNTVIPTTTKVLDQVGSDSLVVSPDGITITMSSSSPVAQSLAPGDILAIGVTASTPRGLLRKIVSVTQTGSTIVATTVQGTLAEAFQEATFTYQSTVAPKSFRPASTLRHGVKVFEGSPPKNATQAQSSSLQDPCATNTATFVEMIDVPAVEDSSGALTATGEIEVCPSLQFDWSIGGIPVQLNSLSAIVSLSADAHVNVTGRFDTTFDQKVPILTLESADPITILIGDVPIVIFPELTFFVGATGDVTVGFSTGMTETTTVEAGLSYANGQFSPIHKITNEFEKDPYGIDAGMSVRGFAGVTINLYVDGVLTPSFSPDGFLQLDVNPTQDPWWTLSGGLEGSGGVKVSIFGIADLVDYEDSNLFQYPTPPYDIYNPGVGFSASNAAPALGSVTPNAVGADSPDLTIVISGSNFVPGAVVNFNGTPLPTQFASPLNLTATVPSSDLMSAGTFPVTVSNPDTQGATSDSIYFAVAGNAFPSVTAISPSSTDAGGSSFTLTVNGKNFISSSMVEWNDSSRATTYVSPTELQAAITAADIATPGVAQVTVVTPTPGGGTSNSAAFNIAFPSGHKIGVVQTLSAGTLGDYESVNAALSSTGRYVAFYSSATNVVSPSTSWPETYWHDACIGATSCTPQTQLASAISGTSSEGNGAGADPLTTITSDGRFVGFSSSATNLLTSATTQHDAYGRDTCSGAPSGCIPSTFLLSLTSTGAEANGTSYAPVFSGNGRYGAFVSDGNNLVPGATLPESEVYLRDTCQTTSGPVSGCPPTTILVSADNSGSEANRGVFTGTGEVDVAISADGRFVAFESSSTNLVPGVTDGNNHVYVRDTCLGVALGCSPSTILASTDSSGNPAVSGGSGLINDISISADGRYVSFTTLDALVPTDTNGQSDVYLRDTCQSSNGPVAACTPSTTLISATPDGSAAGNGSSGASSYALSSTGRFVAFYSHATNLTLGTLPGYPAQAFVRDTCLGAPAGCTPTTVVVSVDGSGTLVGNYSGVSIAGDGHYVAFTEVTDGQLDLALTGF